MLTLASTLSGYPPTSDSSFSISCLSVTTRPQTRPLVHTLSLYLTTNPDHLDPKFLILSHSTTFFSCFSGFVYLIVVVGYMMHMELQLGLALPSTGIKGFDLNTYACDPNESMGSDPSWNNFGLGSALGCCCANDICGNYKKRSFDKAFHKDEALPRTLPLLNWDKQPNDEDDPKDLDNNTSSFDSNKKTTDEDGIVGWPPVKTWRKKLSHQHRGGRAKSNQIADNGFGCGSRQSNARYVKVKMEGMPIARKIDLSLYDSFQSLTTTLMSMFDMWLEDSNNYKLSYQDREGDWLIAESMPWRTFIRTVQRLKLLKKGD